MFRNPVHYVHGTTDEQFERKLDALLETESPEGAAEWRTRERIEERS